MLKKNNLHVTCAHGALQAYAIHLYIFLIPFSAPSLQKLALYLYQRPFEPRTPINWKQNNKRFMNSYISNKTHNCSYVKKST